WLTVGCRSMAGCMVSSSRGHSGLIRTEPAYRIQDQAQVADPVQQPVQGGLIRDRAGDDRLAVVTADRQALEPGRPARVQEPLDADLVARRPRRVAHLYRPSVRFVICT